MPEIDGRLVCCTCGADLGDAEDPYRDPDCQECTKQEYEQEEEYEDGQEQAWEAEADNIAMHQEFHDHEMGR